MISINPAISILAIQKRIIHKFKTAGATRSSDAVALSDLGISKRLIFNKLVRQGIIMEAQRGYYYLNETREQAIRKKRLDILWTVMMMFAIVVIIAYFWSTI